VFSTQTCDFTEPFTGSHRLYLVFTPIAGGATTGLINLNWVEFGGQGVSVP